MLKLLSDLSDKIDSYIDYAPPFLNATKQLPPHLFSHFLIFFSGLTVLHPYWHHLTVDKLYSLMITARTVKCFNLSTHTINRAASMTPSGSRRAIVPPGPIFRANSSDTSKVIGMGHNIPHFKRIVEHTLS